MAAELGFGGMFAYGKTVDQVDMDDLIRRVDMFMEAGFNLFDNAFSYDAEEAAMEQALFSRYPRESYRVSQKITPWKMPTREKMLENFEHSLVTTSVGYYDYLMLHNVSTQGGRAAMFEEYDAWNFLLEQKERGLARQVGFSFHDKADMLEEYILAHPGADFVMLQLNYMDWESPFIQARANYEVARKYNLPIMVMKPLRGGVLLNLPERISHLFTDAGVDPAALGLRYCASLEGVMAVLSTMRTADEAAHNIAIMKDERPFSDEERALVDSVVQALSESNLINCANCRYCMAVCPKGVRIPWIIQAMNAHRMHGLWNASGDYDWETKWGGKASECIACGKCLSQCAYHLPIIDLMREAVELFEGKPYVRPV